MAWFDVTRTLSPETPVFPEDPPFRFREILTGSFRITEVCMGTHTGTHIDAPCHVHDGAGGIDEVPLHNLVGTCSVVDCTAWDGPIGSDVLEDYVGVASRVLLKTIPSDPRYLPHAFIDRRSADYLVRKCVRCVGTDALSIEKPDGNGEVHRRLLGAGIPIIELLDLSAVPEGTYWMAALPLRMKGLDGSPARVILSNCERSKCLDHS